MKRGAEFSVYQGGSPARRPPNPPPNPPPHPPPPDNMNLRAKQRSLTNLTLLSDGEQRVYSFELDDARPRISKPHNSSPSPSSLQGSPRKEAVARGTTRTRSLSLSLTKMLSQSEQSLIPVPSRCSGGRKERASYGGHARTESARTSREVEEKEDEGGSNEEGKTRGGRTMGIGRRRRFRREGEEKERPQLDKELILTMLGDLEQVLHTETRPPRKSPPADIGRKGRGSHCIDVYVWRRLKQEGDAISKHGVSWNKNICKFYENHFVFCAMEVGLLLRRLVTFNGTFLRGYVWRQHSPDFVEYVQK
ncbi:hypothetical protein KUCAC02_024889 [Chaenocephalus aceratus]|nr:hypothetical protein KUCAC02_024889 [Chaenocephalus aceratus]